MQRSIVKASLIASLLLVAAACGKTPDTASAVTAASIQDIRATNCEVFVDKVRVYHSSHGFTGAVLFVKLLNDRLDGDVTKVAFFAKHTYENYYGDRTVEDWQAYEGQKFAGANDYYEVRSYNYDGFVVGADYSSDHVWLGAVYVETSTGKRYWSNTHDGGNFWLDHNSIAAMQPWVNNSLSNVPKTADQLTYWNPQRCR